MDVTRYARQMRFRPIGETGQKRLADARVAVVGVGALGCVIAQHLVRSGVGFVRLIDRDIVEWSNLQRQLLYTEQDAEDLLPKAEAAARRLGAMNGTVAIEAVAADLSADNAESLLDGVELIVDGTDNFTVRYLVNDYAIKHGVPWIYGGAVGASGMTMTILPDETPCYRCVFPETPPPGASDTCETAGVISPIVDVIGSLQATEALKLLSGNREALHGTLFQADLWNHAWLPLSIRHAKRPDCPVCGEERRFEYLDHDEQVPIAAALCGRNSVHLTPGTKVALDLGQLAERLSAAGELDQNPYLLRVKLKNDMTFVLFSDGRAIIQGTEETSKARSIYAELLGI
ncbi:ThiF family adenylyltransferase [Paenibacillus sp. LHD-117]|uniref:ThiF family adenylyltransferase n=1 Tax=Paenibacillus sp. LHD-117 TaxID=3071412 RepID=UPI0027DF8D78|nr:ThiF family adenylyltransferase [Paenibacillus sp. LHD-117]MDQ6418317.1 ThiF family adenylyltransferase [Paenibacillus sp. LHD-117]